MLANLAPSCLPPEIRTIFERLVSKSAFVLSGGDKGGLMSKVDEQYVLDIEREAFMSLAGEEKTQQRIAHFLKTGKPLRN